MLREMKKKVNSLKFKIGKNENYVRMTDMSSSGAVFSRTNACVLLQPVSFDP